MKQTLKKNLSVILTLCMILSIFAGMGVTSHAADTDTGTSTETELLDLTNPFNDVSETDWYYGDVLWAYENSLMQGTDDTTFAPALTTTRGMIANILWRMENQPKAATDMTFTDVPQGEYYHDAVEWAAENKIVNGFDTLTFEPDRVITREQMLTILYRYAQYKDYDVSVGEDTNILSYNDAESISGYAIPAIQWACGETLIQSGLIDILPQSEAQRCQVVAILHRFHDNVVNKQIINVVD